MKKLRMKKINLTKPTFKIDKKQIGNHDIILIVGPNGCGKTSLLENFGEIFPTPKWSKNKAVISEIEDSSIAMKCMNSIGLNSIPSWLKPYHVLSQGEQYRVLLAKTIETCFKTPGCKIILDNFTDNLDRTSAISCAGSLNRCIRRSKEFKKSQWFLSTSNRDVIPFLQPSLVIEIDEQQNIKYFKNPNKDKRIKVMAKMELSESWKIETKKLNHMEVPNYIAIRDLKVKKEIDCSKMAIVQLRSTVHVDESTLKAELAFDHPFKGTINFDVPPFPHEEIKKTSFDVGFISGPSGTGKTSIAWEFYGAPFVMKWTKNQTSV
eukprot:UN22745